MDVGINREGRNSESLRHDNTGSLVAHSCEGLKEVPIRPHSSSILYYLLCHSLEIAGLSRSKADLPDNCVNLIDL